MILTRRDSDILQALTHRVRLLSLEQIARTWWRDTKHSEGNAAKRLKELEEEDLLRRHVLHAHPELPLPCPLFAWTPGQPRPDYGALSYRCMSRWTEPFRPTPAFLATRRAANHFGGILRKPPKEVEENHDLHLAGMFLRVRASRPALLPHWLSEAKVKRSRPDAPGEKLPDALIRVAGGDPIAFEFGGAYPRDKVQSFHEWCERKGHGYELW